MGLSILDLVLRKLRNEGFQADVAFPGQKYPVITEPVAAVHIAKVDRANLDVTLEVSVISPASLGGAQCEVEALKVTEVLRWSGATCVQNGCEYDGLAQVYVVSILATYTCITEADACTLGPGFTVSVNEIPMPDVVSFQAEQVWEMNPQYEMGVEEPVGIGGGSWIWNLRLEELIPAGSEEPGRFDEGEFELEVFGDTASERFLNCQWTRIQREYTRQGLRRTRSGISLERRIILHGENEL